MLRMNLNEIKGQIQIFPETWINLHETNCYAYALGLDINENKICDFAFQPGMISETIFLPDLDSFSYETLIDAIEADLKTLDLLYREIDPQEEVETDEWKVALMVEKFDDNQELLDNFHFLRTNKNNNWVHKSSYLGSISKKDDLNRSITEPRECEILPYQYKKCYALKVNRK